MIAEFSKETLLPNDWLSHSVDDIARLAPVQPIRWPLLNNAGVELAIKREDLLHPQLSGNKFYKLHGHIQRYLALKKQKIITFGGAYSNHLYATAAAGQSLAIPTFGVVRGERPKRLSPTLRDAESMGMTLRYVSRADYAKKEDPSWLESLQSCIGGSAYVIPEGGGGIVGSEGCAYWARQSIDMSPWRPTHICLAAGTGGTAAGVVAAADGASVHAFLALKGQDPELHAFTEQVYCHSKLLREKLRLNDQKSSAFILEGDYHCGGYARFPAELKRFMLALEGQLGFLLDPVYTAKLFWGIAQKAEVGLWPKNSRLLVLHTGGLQGRRGFSHVL